MKICAITMVYRDYWALEQWYRWYGKHIGYGNLYIVAHGHDPEIQRICPDASVIKIPRDDLKNFDRARMRVINAFQSGLNALYDWVIQTDADELVCFDPAKYSSFEELFASTTAPALFALGLNLAEVDGDPPLLEQDCVFAKRAVACVTGNYSKAWAVRKAMPLMWHGVFCGHKRTEKFNFEMPDGVFFVHLKHANLHALETTNIVRRAVADSVGDDWNVNVWADPDRHVKRFFRKLSMVRTEAWDDAVKLGYTQIRDHPVRDAKRGIVKPPFVNYVCKTVLPEWFKAL